MNENAEKDFASWADGLAARAGVHPTDPIANAKDQALVQAGVLSGLALRGGADPSTVWGALNEIERALITPPGELARLRADIENINREVSALCLAWLRPLQESEAPFEGRPVDQHLTPFQQATTEHQPENFAACSNSDLGQRHE